jgi:hypothetical protein
MRSESVNDVLMECVQALGGAKRVGPRLWPELMVDKAQRKLLDALNPDRDHRLSPEQFQVILRWARDAGYHDGWIAFCSLTGYHASEAITNADEVADLHRQMAGMLKQQQEMIQRMEALQR